MKKFLEKILLFSVLVYIPIVFLNYRVDPARLWGSDTIDEATEYLTKGIAIEQFGDMDEGLFQEQMIEKLNWTPDVVVIGSSHVMYLPLPYDNYYCAGMSGSYLGDYYAIVGLLESNNKLPERIIIGVDPWSFLTSSLEGRHKYLEPYAKKTKSEIGGEKIRTKWNGGNLKKLMEMFSASYYQATLSNISEKGLKYSLRKNKEDVVLVDDEIDANEKTEILPNARFTMPQRKEKLEELEESARSVINSGEIYQLGNSFESVNEKNFAEFKGLIDYLRTKNVEVEIYLPSWYPSVYDYFESSGRFEGVNDLETLIREFGEKEDIVIRGSYNPNLGGVEEEDFHDWLHLTPEKMLDNYNVILQ